MCSAARLVLCLSTCLVRRRYPDGYDSIFYERQPNLSPISLMVGSTEWLLGTMWLYAVFLDDMVHAVPSLFFGTPTEDRCDVEEDWFRV